MTIHHSNSLAKTSPQPVIKTAINIDYDDLMKKFVGEFETKIKDLNTLFSNLKRTISDAQTKKFKVMIEEITHLIQASQGQKDDMEKNFLKNHQKNTKPYKPFTHENDYIDALFEIQNDFVVGYGLDFDGYGRNLKHIYKVCKPEPVIS